MSTQNKTIHVFQTVKDTDHRLSEVAPVVFEKDPVPADMATITVDATNTYQSIEGFGAALTESSAYALTRMSPEKRQEAIAAYFAPGIGLGYTVCRTHINSCDFSLENWACADVDGDTELESFNIERDRQYIIPLIKDAQAVSPDPIKFLASPWSPPAWMKTNGEMNNGGKLKPEYEAAWGLYYAKYIQAYAEEGIPIWAVSVQNEPEAVQTWDSCIWTAEEEGAFVRDHLGPRLQAEGLGDVKIVIWDHNKDVIVRRAQGSLADPEAAKYVWGIGFHWYSGDDFENLDEVHRLFPDKKLLFTEGCQEGGVHMNSWDTGERYGHDIIGDLNNWMVGFIDWNMALDETGGPNHVGNLCDAPIIADGTTDTLHFQSSFYYLGHFSKFIRPGAVRIDSQSSLETLECTAFRNTDGSTAVVVMNRSDEALDFSLAMSDDLAPLSSPAHSILTLVF
jgi:glucosylceramidase